MSVFEQLRRSSYLSGSNAAFLEQLYEGYLQDPESVPAPWRLYFQGLEAGDTQRARDIPHGPIREEFAARARLSGFRAPAVAAGKAEAGLSPEAAEKQAAALRLINAYRVRGHQAANIDPLQLREKQEIPDLDLSFHKLTEADLDRSFNTGSLFTDEQLPLREIIALVQDVYADTIGSEYMHITDTVEKRWIQERLERLRGRFNYSAEQKILLLERLTAAEGLERYLNSKYVGQKRFSLEGGEAMIPMLDHLIQRAGSQGVKEMVMGMAHRGRLNVLVNILGKSPAELFAEFEGNFTHGYSSGDVKYHMGYSSDIQTPGGAVHLALAFNPSHLEIVNPVVEGSVRARMQRRKDYLGQQVMPILIHGDAAFAGQGVVMETLQLSQARGFYTGGTVHIIVNNQIGFTTSNPLDARSTLYSTEVAKMVQAPIFHVNGDDPEAVLFVTELALDFRQRFKKDVVIDLVCYRRHGHNEADEPSATQPMMYSKIKAHLPVRELYAAKLEEEGIYSAGDADGLAQRYRDALDNGQIVARGILEGLHNQYAIDWTPYLKTKWDEPADTTVPVAKIRELQEQLQKLPEGFEL
ncbi:MAG TPA: thiamine pyrophosphate-dependent enzyme, partial [Gammaproteobacteria bacterium]|nr:thiamine pyrophosphate-dependent enzyme [Gammaproteobacteria bacterium]